MKKFPAIFLVFVFILCMAGVALAAAVSQYADVPLGHWSYDAVGKLAETGMIHGYGDGPFRSDRIRTRYEMAQLVANAITKEDQADAGQKILIDKLKAEFADELNSLGVRVTKSEPAKKPNFSIESETLLQFQSDSPPGGQPKMQGNDQWSWRERLYLNAGVNRNTTFDARLATTLSNTQGKFGSVISSSSAAQNDLVIDRAYFTTTQAFGLDKIIWGRQPLLWGQGALSWKTGNNDGVTAFKKIGHATNLQLGAYVVNPTQPNDPVKGNANELQFANLAFQVNPTLLVNTSYYHNNQSQLRDNSPYDYGFDKSQGWDIGFSQKLGAWTLNGEYASTTLHNQVNTADNPKMFAIQLTNGTNLPQYFYPVQRFIVDYKKPHTDAFALSYRVTEKGAVPNGAGFANGKVGTSPSYTSTVLNHLLPFGAVDNLKGYFLTYENVIATNMVLSIEYQNLKFEDSGSAFDKALTTSLQMVF